MGEFCKGVLELGGSVHYRATSSSLDQTRAQKHLFKQFYITFLTQELSPVCSPRVVQCNGVK